MNVPSSRKRERTACVDICFPLEWELSFRPTNTIYGPQADIILLFVDLAGFLRVQLVINLSLHVAEIRDRLQCWICWIVRLLNGII